MGDAGNLRIELRGVGPRELIRNSSATLQLISSIPECNCMRGQFDEWETVAISDFCPIPIQLASVDAKVHPSSDKGDIMGPRNLSLTTNTKNLDGAGECLLGVLGSFQGLNVRACEEDHCEPC